MYQQVSTLIKNRQKVLQVRLEVSLICMSISLSEYIMTDLKCGGLPTSSTQGQAYLIIYGIKGNHFDVPSDFCDSLFIFENNKMIIETDLDMNEHIINGLSLKQLFLSQVIIKNHQVQIVYI